jgi:hypothetical protein
MTLSNVKKMTMDELVERFVAIAVAQDEAIFNDDNPKYNRLYRQMDDVRNELKSRPGDQRSALIPLYEHPNIQVRLKAALTTMEIDPVSAKRALQKIAKSRRYPQAADALAAVLRLDGKPIAPN